MVQKYLPFSNIKQILYMQGQRFLTLMTSKEWAISFNGHIIYFTTFSNFPIQKCIKLASLLTLRWLKICWSGSSWLPYFWPSWWLYDKSQRAVKMVTYREYVYK